MPYDELIRDLRHPLPSVRFAAAAALDDIVQTPEIESALVEASRDPDAKVRRAALHSLSCGHCKPDGCLAPVAVDVLVDTLLHDRSIRLRRWVAGVTMWGQVGGGERMIEAYREVLATTEDPTLRERAATFLASCDVPRGERAHREWIVDWQRRFDVLLAAVS